MHVMDETMKSDKRSVFKQNKIFENTLLAKTKTPFWCTQSLMELQSANDDFSCESIIFFDASKRKQMK